MALTIEELESIREQLIGRCWYVCRRRNFSTCGQGRCWTAISIRRVNEELEALEKEETDADEE